MARIFSDSFNEAVNKALALHVPDTGTSWTVVVNNSRLIYAGGSVALPVSSGSGGSLYSADCTYNTPNYEITFKVANAGQNESCQVAALRIQDSSNFYFLNVSGHKSCNDTIGRLDLYRIKSGTTSSVLVGNGTGASPNYVEVVTNDIVRFRVTSSYDDASVYLSVYVNGTLQYTYTDSSSDRITSAGKAGIGIGQVASVVPAPTSFSQKADDFYVDEVFITAGASGVTCGGSAIVSFNAAPFVAVAEGGVTMGGTAPFKVRYRYIPEGGASLAGDNTDQKMSFNYATTGGVVIDGAATTSINGGNYIWESQGGISLSGSSTTSQVYYYLYDTSGGITLGGAADTPNPENRQVASGGVTLAGDSICTLRVSHVATGGITLSGDSLQRMRFRYVSGAGVYDNGFAYRRKLTIAAGTVAQTLTNFPLPMMLSFSGNKIRSDGFDLYFTDLAGNALTYDRDGWSGNSGVVYLKLPTISATEATSFYVYYGKGEQATTLDNPTNTYDSNFKAVYHLTEDTLNYPDSTSNDKDGVGGNGVSANNPRFIFGALWIGTQYDSNAFINCPNDGILATSPITVTGWVWSLSAIGQRDFFSRGRTSSGQSWSIRIGQQDGGNVYASVRTVNGSVWETTTVNTSETLYGNGYRHVAAVWNPGVGLSVYVDGVLAGFSAKTATTLASSSGVSSIGRTDNGNYWNGYVDELRISNTARSAAWIKAEYDFVDAYFTFGSSSLLASTAEQPAMHVDGEAALNVTRHYVASGGITLGGSANVRRTIGYVATGGITLGGGATFAFKHVASGGLSLGGSAVTVNKQRTVGSGGIQVSGNAITSYRRSYVATSSGGVTLGGSGLIKIKLASVPTGGITLGGSATTSYKTRGRITATGGLSISGTSGLRVGRKSGASGGIVLGGSAIGRHTGTFRHTASGGITLGGSASKSQRFSHVGTGGLTLGGSSPARMRTRVTATGGITLGGSANVRRRFRYVATGGLSLSGAIQLRRFYANPSGGITLGGAALLRRRFVYVASGGIRLTSPVPLNFSATIYTGPRIKCTIETFPAIVATMETTPEIVSLTTS